MKVGFKCFLSSGFRFGSLEALRRWLPRTAVGCPVPRGSDAGLQGHCPRRGETRCLGDQEGGNGRSKPHGPLAGRPAGGPRGAPRTVEAGDSMELWAVRI